MIYVDINKIDIGRSNRLELFNTAHRTQTLNIIVRISSNYMWNWQQACTALWSL